MKNRLCELKNGVFYVKMGNLAKRYTGASLALRWRHAGITDFRTQIRHRLGQDRTGTHPFQRDEQHPPRICAPKILPLPHLMPFIYDIYDEPTTYPRLRRRQIRTLAQVSVTAFLSRMWFLGGTRNWLRRKRSRLSIGTNSLD